MAGVVGIPRSWIGKVPSRVVAQPVAVEHALARFSIPGKGHVVDVAPVKEAAVESPRIEAWCWLRHSPASPVRIVKGSFGVVAQHAAIAVGAEVDVASVKDQADVHVHAQRLGVKRLPAGWIASHRRCSAAPDRWSAGQSKCGVRRRARRQSRWPAVRADGRQRSGSSARL